MSSSGRQRFGQQSLLSLSHADDSYDAGYCVIATIALTITTTNIFIHVINIVYCYCYYCWYFNCSYDLLFLLLLLSLVGILDTKMDLIILRVASLMDYGCYSLLQPRLELDTS